MDLYYYVTDINRKTCELRIDEPIGITAEPSVGGLPILEYCHNHNDLSKVQTHPQLQTNSLKERLSRAADFPNGGVSVIANWVNQ